MRTTAPVLASLLVLGACERQDPRPAGQAPPRDEQRRPAAPEPPLREGVARMYLPTGDKESSPLRLDKEMPAQARRDVPFTVGLTVTNVSAQGLRHLVVRERLPRGFRPEPSTPVELRDGAAIWSLPALNPGESKEFRFAGRLPDAGTFRSCTSVTYEPELCTQLEVTAPALTLQAEAPREILVCDPLVLKARVANAGTARLPDVRVEARVPDGPPATADAGPLDVGQSKDVELRLKAPRTGELAPALVARAGDVTAEATARTAVREPVLALEQTAPAEATVGGKVAEARLVVRNTGDGPARDALVEQRFGDGAQLVGVDAQGRPDGRVVRWTLGTIEPGQARTLSVAYTATEARRVESTVRATAYCAKEATAAAATEFRGVPAVLLEVVDDNDPVRAGGHVVYTLAVLNQGTTPQTNVRVTARLDRGMEFVSGDGPTPVSTRDAAVEPGVVQSLAPGARATWRLTVRATQPGAMRFEVELRTNELPQAVAEIEPTRVFE